MSGSAAQAPAVLEVEDLRTVIRHGDRELPVVRGVSFEVRAGEAVALVGESGSGKSLTALSVMGLLPQAAQVSGGSLRLAGTDLGRLTEIERRRLRGAEIAMIYQDPMTSLNPLMRVGAQVVEGLEAHGMRGADARDQCWRFRLLERGDRSATCAGSCCCSGPPPSSAAPDTPPASLRTGGYAVRCCD